MTLADNILTTWYPANHPFHLDPLPAALGLAGEAGELIDLYKKDRFKDGFSWWECTHCGTTRPEDSCQENYTPKILDELGDFWYYLRILAYQQKWEIPGNWETDNAPAKFLSILDTLTKLNFHCAKLLGDYENIGSEKLTKVFSWFLDLVSLLDITLDQLTESNWAKLKDGDNNGWGKTLGND